MKPYTLVILGRDVPSFDDCYASAHMLMVGIRDAFWKLEHVETYTRQIDQWRTCNWPVAQFALIVAYQQEAPPNEELKQRSRVAYTASFRESRQRFDHSFVFQTPDEPSDSMTYIRLPCAKNYVRAHNVTPKVPGSVMIDHAWEPFLGTEHAWTAQIEEWLEEWMNEGNRSNARTVYRMLRDRYDRGRAAEYTIQVPLSFYPVYLNSTAHIERFIVTHRECYPWAVTDMAARGTQVLSPRGFIPESVAWQLGVEQFGNKDELLAILARPVADEWRRKIEMFTDYDECARIIDTKFQKVLS